MRPKYKIQDELYQFPYHYIPHFDSSDRVHLIRSMGWGLEYLCYQKFAKNLIEGLQPNSVLEVGCGDGYLIGSLSPDITRRVGVDLSERAIAFAKAFHPAVPFFAKSIDTLEEQFDIVVAMEVLEHIPDDEITKFVNSMGARLKSGGRIIVSVPTVVARINKKHYRHYNLQILTDQFANVEGHMKFEEVHYIYRKTIMSRIVEKLARNKFANIHIPFLTNTAWKFIQKFACKTDEHHGLHLVVVIKRL